jgi:hypothetical protein
MPTIGPSFDDTPAVWTDWVVAFDSMDAAIEAEMAGRRQAQLFGGR